MRAALCALWCAAVLPAQVRVVTSLPAAAAVTVERYVRSRLPDLEPRFVQRTTDDLWDSAVHARAVDADVLAGVDAQVLELLAADAMLARLGAPVPAGLAPFHAGAGGFYVVPWADAWVVARDARFHAAGAAPRTLDAMLDPRFVDRLVMPEPQAAPSLFVAWIRGALRDGDSTDAVFGKLATLDARVRAWRAPGAATVADLVAEPERTFAVAPLSAVRAALGTLAYEVLEPFVPLQGLGVAIPAEAIDRDAAARVAAVLLEPDLAHRLCIDHGLLPGIERAPDGAEPVPEPVRDLVAHAAPVDPDRDHVEAWFVRFDSDVRGRGRYSETLDLVLDGVFLLLFVVAMLWIYRKSQVAEG